MSDNFTSDHVEDESQTSIDGFDHFTIIANGVQFSLIGLGPQDGELALCLHGFPDTAYTWRYLLGPLAKAGYRAVAPFQRGYWPTSTPPGSSFQTGALVADACAIASQLSPGNQGVIIGHDWGAFSAYGAAAYQPGAWRRVVTCAVPPVAAMASAFFSVDQLKRSWYMFFFQVPLAEAAIMMNDLALIERLWNDWSPGYNATDDLIHVKRALRNEDNLSSAIGYYRAMFDSTRHDDSLAQYQAAVMAPTPQPLLYMHGRNDGCLDVELALAAKTYLNAESKMHIVEDAGHFMNVEQPEEFNARVLEFLGPAQPKIPAT